MNLKKAKDFAKKSYKNIKRKSGEQYYLHTFAVADYLINWQADEDTVIAGLLHDSVVVGNSTYEQIEAEFGENVANLVRGVDQLKDMHVPLTAMTKKETVKKLFFVLAQDTRAMIIKLADRLHNMSTLEYLDEEVRLKKAIETLDIYAPIAERMGMGQVKAQLELLSFVYVYPKEYKKMNKISQEHYHKTEEDIKALKNTIASAADEYGIENLTIDAREKNLYSLWKKLQRDSINGDISKVHDIVALRAIVDNKEDCYLLLGIIHDLYEPNVKIGISDYIAKPKPNGYQSIHTKIFSPSGRIVEVQIRTYEMHSLAEFGLAAHWTYAEAKSSGASDHSLEKSNYHQNNKRNQSWVKELMGWKEGEVTLSSLENRIFVYTPNRDVIELPRDATPVDFAYRVHSDIGNYIKGAKVNGKMVPLSYKLTTSDIVEIIKHKNPVKPSRDWIDFVVTDMARRKIAQAYK